MIQRIQSLYLLLAAIISIVVLFLTIGTIYTDAEQDQKTELYFQIYKDRDILNPELWIAR